MSEASNAKQTPKSDIRNIIPNYALNVEGAKRILDRIGITANDLGVSITDDGKCAPPKTPTWRSTRFQGHAKQLAPMAVVASEFIEGWIKKDAELIKQGLPIETVNDISETIFRSVAETVGKQLDELAKQLGLPTAPPN
jgi:hypothetical protein